MHHVWFKGRLARLAVAVAMAFGCVATIVLPASPALAASCSGGSCRGVDPQNAGCSSGAVTVSGSYVSLNNHNGQTTMAMELRSSSTCKARWGRWTNDIGQDMCCSYSELRIERQIMSPYGWFTADVYRKVIPPWGSGSYWTPMVENTPGADDRERVCWKYSSSDPDAASQCHSVWYY